MAELSPQERSMRARLAAHVLHSRVDGREHTRKAREAFDARFEKQVDPDGVLSPEERTRRAESARKAHFISLQIKSAEARKRRAA